MSVPSVRRPIRQILSAFLAPPCGSFSLINASVCRSESDPWCLKPQKTDKARDAITIGNKCMRAAIEIIKWLESCGIPWILEHPLTSRAWYLPFFKSLVRKPHVVAVVCDQCQYGARWRKSTKLVCSRIEPSCFDRLSKRCHKDPEGQCGRTHKFHIQLRGTHPCGKPWTSLASAYPTQLARHIAYSLLEPHIMKYPYGNHSRNRM